MKVFRPELKKIGNDEYIIDFKQDFSIDGSLNGVGLCLGFFDGVHQGHKELLRRLVYISKEQGYSPDVWTFDSVPKFSANANNYLESREQCLEELASIGIARVFMQKFNEDLANMSGDAFLQNILNYLPVKLIVVGYDFRFGHGMSCGIAELAAFAKLNDIRLEVVEPVKLLGLPVHSTTIRQAILDGDLEYASALYGKDYTIRGTVIAGNKIGRRLGFATANILLDDDSVLPPHGVYRSRVKVDEWYYMAISFLGKRPTIHEEKKRLILETYLFDENMDLYGKKIDVSLCEFIRPELNFPNIADLQQQITDDVARVKRAFTEDRRMNLLADYGRLKVYMLPISDFRMAYSRIAVRLPHSKISGDYGLAMAYLAKTTATHPQPIDLNRALQELYGADIFANSQKIGNVLEVQLNASALQQNFAGINPFEETLALAFQALLNPNQEKDGSWNQELWRQERQNALDEWASQQASKATKAWNRTLELLFPDSVHSLSTLGDIEYLQSTSIENCVAAYRQMLTEGEISIYIAAKPTRSLWELLQEKIPAVLNKAVELKRTASGEAKTGAKQTQAEFYCEIPDNFKSLPGVYPEPVNPAYKGSCREYKDIEQSRLQIVIDNHIPYVSLQATLAVLLNAVLGGDSGSIFFDLVREKHGLAYEIYSTNLLFRRCMVIVAGIRPGKENKAVDLIKSTWCELKKTGIDAENLQRAKAMLQSDLQLLADKPAALLEYHISQKNLGWNLTPATYADLLEAVTAEDLQAIIAKQTWQIDYILAALATEATLGQEVENSGN